MVPRQRPEGGSVRSIVRETARRALLPRDSQRHQRPDHRAALSRCVARRRGNRSALYLHCHGQCRAPAPRDAGLRGHRPGHVPDRCSQNRSCHHAAHASDHARAHRRLVRRPRDDPGDRATAQDPRYRRRLPGASRRMEGAPAGQSRRGGMLQLPGFKESQLRRRRRDGHQRREPGGARLRFSQQRRRAETQQRIFIRRNAAPTCGSRNFRPRCCWPR